jgi:phosphoribosylformylglycinamidine cyclo-ligase
MLFLDYFASSKLDKEEIGYFIKGVSDMCKEVGCVLLGGETAEMPTVYNENREDMVGTIVGRLADNRYINTDNIVEGDILYNLESNGLHTNGYSLVNKLVKGDEDEEILQLLCNSHKCYMSDVKKIRERIDIHGLCHITGGGIKENIPRILPSNLTAVFEKIKFPKVFDWIKKEGKVSEDEMLRVFNCGIGMIVIGDSESEGAMNDLGYKRIGYIRKKS